MGRTLFYIGTVLSLINVGIDIRFDIPTGDAEMMDLQLGALTAMVIGIGFHVLRSKP